MVVGSDFPVQLSTATSLFPEFESGACFHPPDVRAGVERVLGPRAEAGGFIGRHRARRGSSPSWNPAEAPSTGPPKLGVSTRPALRRGSGRTNWLRTLQCGTTRSILSHAGRGEPAAMAIISIEPLDGSRRAPDAVMLHQPPALGSFRGPLHRLFLIVGEHEGPASLWLAAASGGRWALHRLGGPSDFAAGCAWRNLCAPAAGVRGRRADDHATKQINYKIRRAIPWGKVAW